MIDSSRRRRAFTLVEMMFTISLIAILLAIAVPNWIQARTRTNARACQKQLQMLRSAKESYVMSHNLGTSTTITMTDLVNDGWLHTGLICPDGFAYVLGAVDQDPTCTSSLTDHVMP